MSNKISKTFQYGENTVVMETAEIARQASGAVLLSMGDTTVLATVVAVKTADPSRGFFPLTVNYQEKTYAVGKIPGSYFRREGRPSERETLICRLIDRPLRPLFPKGFKNEVQVVVTVMSMDPEIDTDIPALLAASAAIQVSGVPFNGPVGAARVGYIDNQYKLNPSATEMQDSALDLVVAGTEPAVLMVESEAKQLTEEVMLGAVMFGHQQMQTAITAIREFADESGRAGRVWDWSAPETDSALQEKVSQHISSELAAAYAISEKAERYTRLQKMRADTIEALSDESENTPAAEQVQKIIYNLESTHVRNQVLETGQRIDGRDTQTVRDIRIEVGKLKRPHGSVVFTRGETQAIVTTTLGSDRDAQRLDELTGDQRQTFMLHYNFPPYSVGEAGFMGSPKRREIGHGRLAWRALNAVVPSEDEFPYVLRVVSEITESNGSSSMASVCGGSLSLMDAGVPVKAPVAGIAMGLIKEGDKFAVLTDILGDEDHLGDMDFKVAGTEQGVTALQMDIKIQGITQEIMQQALAQANAGRLHILGVMQQAISEPRSEVSEHAPSIVSFKIDKERIGEVIGKGGAIIRELCETTESTIDIAEDGTVKIFAINRSMADSAKQQIDELLAEPEVGMTYEGKVVKLMDFGAFVAYMPKQEGLVHISQICEERVEKVSDHLSEGQEVRVKVIEIDRQGRVRLSIKQADKQDTQDNDKDA